MRGFPFFAFLTVAINMHKNSKISLYTMHIRPKNISKKTQNGLDRFTFIL